MMLRFLLDENLPSRFSRAVERHCLCGDWPLDVVRVGHPDELPLGSTDSTILEWAERNNRILITEDRNTMPQHLEDHLAGGHHSPGVLLVRGDVRMAALLEYLVLIAYTSDDYEWQDRIVFVP